MARLVVDAMNVIGSRPTGWWRDRPGAVRRLVADLGRLAEESGDEIVAVVDGRPLAGLEPGAQGGVTVEYARRSGSDAADDRIVELVEADATPETLTVVTSDRRLRERVGALGAGFTGTRSLLERIDALPR